GNDLDVGPGDGFLELVEGEIAPGVGKTDIANRFDLAVDHVVDDALDHQTGRLHSGKHPRLVAGWRYVRRHDDQRRLAGGDRFGHGGGKSNHHRPDDHVNLVLGNQLAGVAYRRGGVGGIVQRDHGDLLAVEFGGDEFGGLADFRADRCGRAGERTDDADGDVG